MGNKIICFNFFCETKTKHKFSSGNITFSAQIKTSAYKNYLQNDFLQMEYYIELLVHLIFLFLKDRNI